MIVWMMTDMEGIAGLDHFDQFMGEFGTPQRDYGRQQLVADVNAAAAGCFDAGATKVYALDGHGPNEGKGFLLDQLDPRITVDRELTFDPTRFHNLNEHVDAFMMIGQHAMAGTLNAYRDHTQMSRRVCRYKINGVEYGEMGQHAAYAGYYDIPLVYVAGDEACCAEARRQFPHARCTATKQGLGFDECELYDVDEVRRNIRRNAAEALKHIDKRNAWKLKRLIEIEWEWAWTGFAEKFTPYPNVHRPHPRVTRWVINDPRDVFALPSPDWHPPAG